jgi:hypothetical protein
VGSGTCAVCHTDPRYRAAFSHRGLEESGEGCLACHSGAEAHVAARGGKGSIATPKSGTAAEERALCLGCHEEETYGAKVHLAPLAADARCTACHVLHGEGKPVRGPAPGGGGAAPGAKEGPDAPGTAAPAKGKAWIHGRAEAGYRWVGKEEGRYAQDVNLRQGPRLFSAGVEAGADDADPLAPRLEARIDGANDPHSSARLFARRGDLWRFDARGRRDEQPFLGGNGLHPGEALRQSVDASADFRLSALAHAGLGFSAAEHDQDVRGTLFDNGSVVPVDMDLDRATREAWGSLDLRGRGWRAGIRQGWTWEQGDEGRSRRESVPGTPDVLLFDDGSRMSGPVSSATAGADLLGGALTVDLRASRSLLDRDVDTSELRRSVLGATRVERLQDVEGQRDRVVDSEGADLALALGGAWALEAGAERRALREEGRLRDTTSVDTGAGPTVTVTARDDLVTQRVLRESAGIRYVFEGGFTLRGGAEYSSDELDAPGTAAPGDPVRSRGAYLGASGRVSEPLTLRADVRTLRTRGAFTPLTPRETDRARFEATWREASGLRAGLGWQGSRLAAHDSGLASRGNTVRASAGAGKPDALTADLSWTARTLRLEADTLATVGPGLRAGTASSRIRSHLVDATVGVPLSPRVRLLGSLGWATDRGDLPVTAWDASASLRWEIGERTALRILARRRVYDERGASFRDYGTDILEAAVEAGF